MRGSPPTAYSLLNCRTRSGVVSTATGPAPDGGRAGAEPVRQPADGPPGDAGARRGGLVHRVAGRGTYPVTHYDRYLRHLGSIEDPMSLSLDNGCEIIVPCTLSRTRRLPGASDSTATRSTRSRRPAAQRRAVLPHLALATAGDRPGARGRRGADRTISGWLGAPSMLHPPDVSSTRPWTLDTAGPGGTGCIHRTNTAVLSPFGTGRVPGAGRLARGRTATNGGSSWQTEQPSASSPAGP
jgi:hypothetical protein